MTTKMKQSKAPVINVAHARLFARACDAADSMSEACAKLAAEILGARRGLEAYKSGIKEIAALASASEDSNANTVKRYAGEALAIFAQHGRKVEVPSGSKVRTEKAQAARVSLGAKKQPKGANANRTVTTPTATPMPAQTFAQAFTTKLATPAGRAEISVLAAAAGYILSLAIKPRIDHLPGVTAQLPAPHAPKPITLKAIPPKATKGNGKQVAARK